MSNTFGKNIRVTVFGQSHSEAVGVCIDGLPAGLEIDADELSAFMKRRAPGQGGHTTQRKEADEINFLSGLAGGITCGAPLAAFIANTDARSADYDNLRDVPRPSHADYTAHVKYGGKNDVRGGGAFSGRLTAPLCVAGGICMQLLKRKNIFVFAHALQIGNARGVPFDPASVGEAERKILSGAKFPALDETAAAKMLEAISGAKQNGGSVGGIVECAVTGMPAGFGGPMFDGLESLLSSILFSIPAVKGVEFGSGFSCVSMTGIEHNDAFFMRGEKIETKTNNHGGILGGISSGMPIVFRTAFKP
ncbi:MAG: chorismate synthase, partial [Defluviitaleaceae bacterium]|nr:chorismate synthase [Defluviitaleaceae bacterium]